MKLEMTKKQAFQAQRAVDTAALNGIVFLAMLLKRHECVTHDEVEMLHAMMSKPLGLSDHAANPLVQITQQHLDEQFATILDQTSG